MPITGKRHCQRTNPNKKHEEGDVPGDYGANGIRHVSGMELVMPFSLLLVYIVVSTSAWHAIFRGCGWSVTLKLGQYRLPHIACVFRMRRYKPFLSVVYARGSKTSRTGGKCVTCRGLHILAQGRTTL